MRISSHFSAVVAPMTQGLLSCRDVQLVHKVTLTVMIVHNLQECRYIQLLVGSLQVAQSSAATDDRLYVVL